jgi:hypothetical protein
MVKSGVCENCGRVADDVLAGRSFHKVDVPVAAANSMQPNLSALWYAEFSSAKNRRE